MCPTHRAEIGESIAYNLSRFIHDAAAMFHLQMDATLRMCQIVKIFTIRDWGGDFIRKFTTWPVLSQSFAVKTQKKSGSRLALEKNFDLHLWTSLNFVIWPILQHLLIFITLRGKGLHPTWSLSNKCPVPSGSLFLYDRDTRGMRRSAHH